MSRAPRRRHARVDPDGREVHSASPYKQAKTFGSLLLLVGLFTRLAALVMSGEMAFAYFIAHAPKSFYPAANGRSLAVLYYFVFLYLVFAGGGPWSIRPRRVEAGAS